MAHRPLCNTVKNHTVPQFYLRNFKNDKEIIFILDTKKSKIFQTKNTNNIGCENDVYTINSKITQSDINKFYELTVNFKRNPIIDDFINLLVSFLNDEMGNLFEIKVRGDAVVDDEKLKSLDGMLKDGLNTPDMSRNQELLFGVYESSFISIYESILRTRKIPKNDPEVEMSILDYLISKTILSIFNMLERKVEQNFPIPDESPHITQYETAKEKIRDFPVVPYYDFLRYLVVQFSRSSKKMNLKRLDAEAKKKFLECEQREKISFPNIMILMVHYYGIIITNNLFIEKYKGILLENKTSIPFITSDEPAINPYVLEMQGNELKRGEFEIYFPLSPSLAVLLTARQEYIGKEIHEITDPKEIHLLNLAIYKESDRFVYSNCKQTLAELWKSA